MAGNRIETVTIEGARLVFRNFEGKEGRYNREGDRSFGVILDEGIAEQMLKDGWNVKHLKPREDDEDGEPTPYLLVSVNYKGRPPRIVGITSRGRTPFDEDTVAVLDWAEITNADMVLRPYEWTVNGATGVKAYLQTLFVTIHEDPIELKYADIQEVENHG